MNIFSILLLSFGIFTHLPADIYNFFPKSVSLTKNEHQYKLRLTGASTRKKFFIKIYNVASYLSEEAEGPLLDAVMDDKNTKQLTVKWIYNADLERFRNGYLASFKSALPEEEYSTLRNEIQKYLSFFRKDIKKGDEHILRWFPGGYIEVLINGNVAGTISNLSFAKALWGIWFSGDSSDNGGSLLRS